MDVLIAGCGYLGQELGHRLSARGDQIAGLRRFPPKNSQSPFPILAGDLFRRTGLDCLTSVPKQVVYCAAAESYHDEAYRLAYGVGPQMLMRRFEDLGGLPERILFVSSTAVYHQDDGSWVDERSPCMPQSFSGRRLLEAEAFIASLPTEKSILRCSGIYGPGRRHLLDQFLSGAARMTAKKDQGNRIHRDDVAAALIHLLDLENPKGLYLGSDHTPATKDEIWRWLSLETGRPEPAQQEDDQAPLRFVGNKRCRNDRLVDSGFEFVFPSFREGYRALLTET